MVVYSLHIFNLESDDELIVSEDEDKTEKELTDNVRLAKLKYIFLKEGAQFAQAIENVIPIASDLLGSKNVSDVKEAVQFIESASRYEVEGAKDGIRKMLVSRAC